MPPVETRQRMLTSTAILLREQGYTGTSFGDVIEHSGAPRGSIYHHFPGGKAQLVEEAIELTGDFVDRALAKAANEGDPIAAVRAFLGAFEQGLVATDFRAGCPVVAVAVEAHDDAPELTAAAGAAFARWQGSLATALRGAGVAKARSERLAMLVIASIEGAIVVARAERSLEPVRQVRKELEGLLAEALA